MPVPDVVREGEQKGIDLAPVGFEGFVFGSDGLPAAGAIVVSSAGGKTLTGLDGHYRLDVRVPLDALEVQITAVGAEERGQVASTSFLSPTSGRAQVDPLWLQAGTCAPSWLPTFGGQPGPDGQVNALAVFDDGSGPALFVGGQFVAAGGVIANDIAKWDGSSWSALGSGMGEASTTLIKTLVVHDDGSGPALYVGGTFTTAGGVLARSIAKWDGSSWSPLGSGMAGGSFGPTVYSLGVYDDGNGLALYAGGAFSSAGGVVAMNIAKWDGSSWSPLGSGLTGTLPIAYALTVYDDGSGPALHVGGSFTSAGGAPASGVAKWDGAGWSSLGTTTGSAFALTVFDDGSGPALYAGGNLSFAGGNPVNRIAKWDGASWSALGSGVNNHVHALTVYDDGDGPALYVGGIFTNAGGAVVNHVAKWNGASWATPATLGVNGSAEALAVYDDGSGPALHVGGLFSLASSLAVDNVARWDGNNWSALGSGMSDPVQALTVFDDGSGPVLYAGGEFRTAGGVSVNKIGRWSGSSWMALGSGLSSGVNALVVFDDGGGPALYAGGEFSVGAGGPANRIACWNGSSWTALGSGLSSRANALVVFDDGGGPALYAAGAFITAGGLPANRIAKWDGATWTALGSGLTSVVNALAVFDDGSGPALYAGGFFTTAGGAPASRIAKWNGSSWTALGSGTNSYVTALTVHDDGSGTALYVGGDFTSAGGAPASRIARWNGSSWTTLGSGLNQRVHSLTTFDDGSGPALYVGGSFSAAGGMAASGIARWDGSSWGALGSGMSSYTTALSSVLALVVHDDGSGPSLYAGGDFPSAIDSGDSHLARWGGCADSLPPELACPLSVVVLDRIASPSGETVLFTVTATDNLDPSPTVVCVPPSGSFFPRGTTIVSCTATDALGNQSTCEFPVTVQLKVRRP